jgi:hypothetical protein
MVFQGRETVPRNIPCLNLWTNHLDRRNLFPTAIPMQSGDLSRFLNVEKNLRQRPSENEVVPPPCGDDKKMRGVGLEYEFTSKKSVEVSGSERIQEIVVRPM